MNKQFMIPILNNEYVVVVCIGDEKFAKKVLKNCGHPATEKIDFKTNRGYCWYYPKCHPVITLSKFPKTPDQIGTLAHEATHAVNDIFEKIGETKSEEVYAHAVGAIVREVLYAKRYFK